MRLYCCGCCRNVNPKLTRGFKVYPHTPSLSTIPFWQCVDCGNFVGCHHKTKTPTKPLGCIPTPELKKERQRIHEILDPLWKSGKMNRGDIYRALSDYMGKEYHTAEIRSVEEAKKVLEFLKNMEGK